MLTCSSIDTSCHTNCCHCCWSVFVFWVVFLHYVRQLKNSVVIVIVMVVLF